MKKSEGEEQLNLHLRARKIKAEREYRFHPTRKFRADFAIPHARLLIEVEGGTWVQGRHATGAGMEKDMEKYNLATLNNWSILRFSTGMVKSGEAIRQIEEFLA